jgi:hypothetical protein
MVKNAGVKATLKKPFSSTELIEAIENLNCDIRSKAQG